MKFNKEEKKILIEAISNEQIKMIIHDHNLYDSPRYIKLESLKVKIKDMWGVWRMEITMCTSEICPMKDTCYRTQANPNTYQSWCNFEYTCNAENGFCDYIEIRRREKI